MNPTRPLIVGERTNVIGSRAFKNLIAEEKWEEATEIARRQVRNGAHIVDVCLQSTDRDEMKDIPPFYEKLIRKVKAPVMIDTTDPTGRRTSADLFARQGADQLDQPGRWRRKVRTACPVAKDYGAALVVGAIDEDPLQAQAFTRERKLAIAQRSVKLLTRNMGFQLRILSWTRWYFHAQPAMKTISAGPWKRSKRLRLIKKNIPVCKDSSGSIEHLVRPARGCPRGRELGFSVLLHQSRSGPGDRECGKARAFRIDSGRGPHPRRKSPVQHSTASVPAGHPSEDLRAAPRIGASSRVNSVQPSINFILPRSRNTSEAAQESEGAKAELSLDQRLANYIIEGSKDGLIDDLKPKWAEGMAPLDIINGPFMAGMAEVGRLFNANELIVAEVLQSAEAMKAAVNHLEQFMEKADTAHARAIMLATVRAMFMTSARISSRSS